MEFNTVNTGKKRQMVLLPEINANSFLLFFEKGSSGYSWTVRDYSRPHGVVERYAKEFNWSASEVRQKARYMFDAPTVDTNLFDFWYAYTLLGNEKFIKNGTALPEAKPLVTPENTVAQSVQPHFPVLNIEALRTLTKANKRQDMERIFCSPDSEDWVTWNLFNVLLFQHASDWWLQLVSAARRANSELQLSTEENDKPSLEFWRRVQTPVAYEQASRLRIRQSGDPRLAARSWDPKPVEGDSEIDLVVTTKRHLVFIEAKLGSDISMRTTYDPVRNQVVRNIDCLLECARGREPFFWMLVRDAGPDHAYCQIINQYKQDPQMLAKELPHRDPALLRRLARDIAIVTWGDLALSDLGTADTDSAELRDVKQELRRRLRAA